MTVGGDLDLSSGNLVVVQDESTCIALKLTARFKLFLGSWFADTRIGVPYLQFVFVQNPDIGVVRQLFADVVTSTPGVSQILQENVSYDPATRVLTATYVVLLVTGFVAVGGVGQPFIVQPQAGTVS